MKRVTKKIVLAGLLAVAIVAPGPMSALSFSLTALRAIKKSSYFTGIQGYFSNLFALTAKQPPIITKQVNDQVPFVAKNPQTQKSVHPKKIDKTDTPTFDLPTFTFTPKKTTTDQYVKTADQTEKERTKKFFSESGLAPDAVIPEINKTIALMRKNRCMIGTKTIKCFTRGPIQLVATIEKKALDRFWLNFTIREGEQQLGYREFPIHFECITEKPGTLYERMRMNPGYFRVYPEYRQKDVGRYLFSLQSALLQSQKNALGEIFPCPDQSCMLPTLKTYYESFGFIEHPRDPRHMVISFRDGKLDPAMALFKAITKGDFASLEKLLNDGFSLDSTLDGVSAVPLAFKQALVHKNTNLRKRLITEYGALKNPESLLLALDYAIFHENTDLLDLLITEYHCLPMALKHVLGHKKTNLLNLLITRYDVLKNQDYLELVLKYTVYYDPNNPELYQIYEKAAALAEKQVTKITKE